MERSSSEFGGPGTSVGLHDQGLLEHQGLLNERSAECSLGPIDDTSSAFENVTQSDVSLLGCLSRPATDLIDR